MIIFGWGCQTIKQIGIAFKQLCGHCHNEEYWVLQKITTWFTIFFIPIFPYSIKYFLSCPVCKYGLTLNQKQIGQIKPVVEINQELIDGKITQAEFQSKIIQLNSLSTEPAQSEEVKEAKTTTSIERNLNYCSNCGTNITSDLKFCGNCGNPTNVSIIKNNK